MHPAPRIAIVALLAASTAAATASAQSVTVLHPTGATQSFAFGASGSQQVGSARVGGRDRASLWNGTAASWTDLNPAGATESVANSTSGSQQVGYAQVGGSNRASLWTGTAASWTDLNPAGSTQSTAWGTSGSQQVGFATVGGITRASLWTGTAASWVDLHALLPAGFVESFAQGISTSGGFTYITGYGFNGTTGREQALLWTIPQASTVIPLPPAAMAAASTLFGLAGISAFRRRRA